MSLLFVGLFFALLPHAHISDYAPDDVLHKLSSFNRTLLDIWFSKETPFQLPSSSTVLHVVRLLDLTVWERPISEAPSPFVTSYKTAVWAGQREAAQKYCSVIRDDNTGVLSGRNPVGEVLKGPCRLLLCYDAVRKGLLALTPLSISGIFCDQI